MAKRQDGGIRLRPVGTRKHRQNAPAYSPAGTGCPAFEQAVENLYKGQNEESFWTLMGALNYALEMETHVLVPLRTALTVHNTPAPWTEHPVPTAKAKDLQLWTLRNEKGRTWLPMFTSAAAACADRSTSARPMADYTLQDAMELALSTEGIDGVVLDPWSHSATLDGALLNGLLHAGHTPEDPGDEKADAGKEAARKGNWAQAVECFEKAAELGSTMGLALLADCIYKGRGTRTNRAEARRMWKEAADSGEILSNIALGDDCAARGDNGRALLYYRRDHRRNSFYLIFGLGHVIKTGIIHDRTSRPAHPCCEGLRAQRIYRKRRRSSHIMFQSERMSHFMGRYKTDSTRHISIVESIRSGPGIDRPGLYPHPGM